MDLLRKWLSQTRVLVPLRSFSDLDVLTFLVSGSAFAYETRHMHDWTVGEGESQYSPHSFQGDGCRVQLLGMSGGPWDMPNYVKKILMRLDFHRFVQRHNNSEAIKRG